MARHSQSEIRLKNKSTPRVRPRKPRKRGAFAGGLGGFSVSGL